MPHVLVIGLDPYRVPGPWDPQPVVDAIAAGLARFAEHGIGAETCLVGLDGSEDVEASVADALRAWPWDCVVIGGGIRTGDGQLELFERVINLVRVHAPQAAIALNASPAGTFDAAARWIDVGRRQSEWTASRTARRHTRGGPSRDRPLEPE